MGYHAWIRGFSAPANIEIPPPSAKFLDDVRRQIDANPAAFGIEDPKKLELPIFTTMIHRDQGLEDRIKALREKSPYDDYQHPEDRHDRHQAHLRNTYSERNAPRKVLRNPRRDSQRTRTAKIEAKAMRQHHSIPAHAEKSHQEAYAS